MSAPVTPVASNTSAEQQARDMLERMGIVNAQSWSAGEVVELANLIADRHRPVVASEEVEALCRSMETNDHDWEPLEVVALLRKLDAERRELEAAVDTAHANGQDWLQQIYDLKAERAEILRISGLVWPPSAAIAKEPTAQSLADQTPADSAAASPGTE